MNAEFKPEWTAALRSGEYKQGQGVLRNDNHEICTYCCLGVLGDLLAKNNLGYQWDEDGYLVRNNGKSRQALDDTYLPTPLESLTGLDGRVQRTLADMNDSRKMSFAQIADYIDTCL